MEPFIEIRLLLVGLLTLIVVCLVFLNFVRQMKQQLIVNFSGFEVSLVNKGVDLFEGGEVNAKPKTEEILDKFNEFELIQKIYKLLVLEEIYLQQGLTVGEFAKKLGVQARIVTRIFEELYGHTFKELINMYRVEYAKERIEEGFLDQYTMEALGNEAGFSSRTTFFNVFKKEIGICPSEYWKNYINDAA